MRSQAAPPTSHRLMEIVAGLKPRKFHRKLRWVVKSCRYAGHGVAGLKCGQNLGLFRTECSHFRCSQSSGQFARPVGPASVAVVVATLKKLTDLREQKLPDASSEMAHLRKRFATIA